jgi:hypothetical protein
VLSLTSSTASPAAISIDTVIAEELARILNETHADVRAHRNRDSDRFRRELAALEPQEDQLTDLLVAGSMDDAAYERSLRRIREQRSDLAQKLDEASELLDDAYPRPSIHFRTRETSQIAVG